MDVEVDGKPIGQTAAKAFFYKEVAPGKHTVTSNELPSVFHLPKDVIHATSFS
jgi:hypothetical protein